MSGHASDEGSEITVVARLYPHEGRQAQAAAAIRAAAPGIQAEDGCLQYDAHLADDGTFVIVERWSSRDALAAHNVGPAVQVLRDGVAGLMRAPAEVLVAVAL